MFVGFAAWFLTLLTVVLGPKPPNPLFLFALVALFFGAVLWLFYAIRCPRCKGRLGTDAVSLVGWSRFTAQINFCPFCGVKLDEIHHP
jgi:hypothetical protein